MERCWWLCYVVRGRGMLGVYVMCVLKGVILNFKPK